MKDLIDKIHDIPIRDIVAGYTTLTKAGVLFKARCPFPGHDDKHASFFLNPNKNTCYCYACNRGGDAITFIQLVKGYARPWDAMVDIAGKYSLPLPDHKEPTPQEAADQNKAQQYKLVYEAASHFYYENLKKFKVAQDFLLTRTTQAMIDRYEIGYADSEWQSLYNHLREKGFKTDIIIDSGLCKVNKNKKIYDFFRERFMFPITDRSGSVVAFSARRLSTDEEQPKYINSAESDIYHKERALFGLTQARTAIAKKEGVYLVEGNFDVTRLVSLGVENTIAPCGTALTPGHIQEIKRYTQNLVLIFDGDAAGTKAIDRSGILAVESGLNCNVIMLPSEEGKTDPDSFFKSIDDFKKYKADNLTDFILWKANQLAGTIKNFPDRKSQAINELSKLILKYDNGSRREMYIEECSKIIPQRKLWNTEISTITKEKTKKETVIHIPEGLSLSDFKRFGFYEEKNCYWFEKGDQVHRGSNFIMKPLFHIQSTMNAKRLYEVINEHGHSEVIELLQKDLVSLQAFKLRIESLGNFLWEAGETELNRLKRYLYEKTDTCFEITQLGWQKQGFFAWANGIYNGEFSSTDKHGIVDHGKKKYYLPALSDIYEKEDTLFMSERRFVHVQKGNIKFNDYCQKLITVFGPNAKIAIAFYIATLYRDIIVQIFNFYPILNLFGPKGAGKTELAVSIMAFFGRQSKGPNINNTSKASLADHVSQVRNACVHIDEYKNNIDFEKIEFLKGLWDGTGRTRMNMDKDKKKETTAVDCGVILSGQEMPNADNALFSRLIYLTFHKVEYSDEEKQEFNELKDIEKQGLTHLTNEILGHRGIMLEKYLEAYDTTCQKLNEYLKTNIIEDRLFKNWAVILAAFVCLEDKLTVPFTSDELIKISVEQLAIQERETKSGNEFSGFWDTFQTLVNQDEIMEGRDYKISIEESITKYSNPSSDSDKNEENFGESKKILYLRYKEMLSIYFANASKYGFKPLSPSSIKYHLTTHPSYVGYTKNVRLGDYKKPFNGFCMVFYYNDLKIDLPEYEPNKQNYDENEPDEKQQMKKLPF